MILELVIMLSERISLIKVGQTKKGQSIQIQMIITLLISE
jgi:hypothetical protein